MKLISSTGGIISAGGRLMRDPLVQQGLHKVLQAKDKLKVEMSVDERDDLNLKTHSAIQLCLADEVLRVTDEDSTTSL